MKKKAAAGKKNLIADLKGRSLLTLNDLSDDEMLGLIELARELKKRRASGVRGGLLEGRHVALIFEKMSTRTRCAASVAAADEGATADYLSSKEIHFGKKESVRDTARVLGRMFDGILFRGFAQSVVEELAKHSGIPVWNGLTDDSHPTQVLADLMTIQEHFGKLAGLKVVYMGDGRNNVATSLMLGCAKAGMDFVNCAPPELEPSKKATSAAAGEAKRTGGSVRVEHDPLTAVKGANVVYTDVWVSMGEEAQFDERLRLLRPYQVNMNLMRATGNVKSGKVIFLHCLPAFHDNETDLTRELGPLEVTDDVFEAPFSLVFDEAENRMHTIKALFVATL
ncbi:MAG: ornithine carbamoyltransferase [Lentisphaerae bacterium]|nr:ornithine carbamoyltransferase [Lentisphaerota bacterium]